EDLLPRLLEELAATEKALSDTALRLRTREQTARDRSASESQIATRFEALGLRSAREGHQQVVAQSSTEAKRQVGLIAAAQAAGEALALRLSRAGEQAALVELEREGTEIRSRLQAEDAELSRRIRSGELAQSVIEGLREATSETVKERIREIEPL